MLGPIVLCTGTKRPGERSPPMTPSPEFVINSLALCTHASVRRNVLTLQFAGMIVVSGFLRGGRLVDVSVTRTWGNRRGTTAASRAVDERRAQAVFAVLGGAL